jgi:hypothetical protein
VSDTRPPPFLALYRLNDGMICTINIAEFEDPGPWGIVLADVIQHLTNGYEGRGFPKEAVRAYILSVLHRELSTPTSEACAVNGAWTEDGFVPVLAGEGEA